MSIKAIVTDIEGTTSSIDFVHQTLFPYARLHLRGFLRACARRPEVAVHVHAVAAEEGRQLTLEDAADVLEHWMAEDRKATPLKALQGMVWAQGYAAGELIGHVYADTPVALRRWHDEGVLLYVYSSGSVEAQQLIFGHTEYGDLTPLFSGYYDTRIGAKREAAAYRTILEDIGLRGDQVLFLSDIGEELDAAREAGLATIQLLRDAKAKPFPHHPAVSDFSEIKLA